MVIITSLISFICIFIVIFLIKNIQKKKLNNYLSDPPDYVDYYSVSINTLSSVFRRITLPVLSKKAEIKRGIFLLMVTIFLYLLFFSSFPGNEDLLRNVQSGNTNDACSPTGDGDGSSGDCSTYGSCNGAGWQLGTSGDCDGDAGCAATTCCGDDEYEFTITEDSSTDAPTGYDNTIPAACCDVSTDCNHNGVCTAAGGNDGSAWCCNTGEESCTESTWYGGDAFSSACTDIVGSGYWNIGGEDCNGGSAGDCSSTCCGDDTGEFRITESSSTDAPAGYNGGITACCGTDTDCNYNDNCVAQGSVSSPSVPSKAYCGSSNTWYGGDTSNTICKEITGGATIDENWDIGGDAVSSPNDLCCGDDSGENRLVQDFDNAGSMDSAEDTNDVACCDSTNDCVDSSNCRTSGSSYSSVDADSDSDYCINGVWKDCQDDTDCDGDNICSETINDCVNPYGYIYIRSLGVTGIEDANENYTSIRSVFLDLNYSTNAEECRYLNYNSGKNKPTDSDSGWTEWEPCVKTRVWILSENPGIKYVYYQINYSDPEQLSLFNDSIYYNYTGAGLDQTKASAATISLDDFSNDNTTIEVSWSGAYDPESITLGIPLQYEYVIYTNETPTRILEQSTTTSTAVTATDESEPYGFNLSHKTKVYVNVTVINSGGLKTKSSTFPSGLIIDLEKPVIIPGSTHSSFTNGSNGEHQSLDSIGENDDIWATGANFSWSAIDYVSQSIDAYSYILSQNQNAEVDNIPEGSVGSFSTHTNKAFTNLKTGKYYFKVKAKDGAGNWGDPYEIKFTTDVTGPSKPEVVSIKQSSTYVSVDWTTSTDIDSGVVLYRVNLTYQDGSTYMNRTTTNTNYTFHNVASGDYNATVGAKNGVGIWTWSNQDDSEVDSTPPEVYATPNRTVDTTEPIIRAWTNEQAVCYNGSIEFSYTNTTYHEFKLYDQSFGTNKTVTINCIDLAGNDQPFTFNFSIINKAADDILPDNGSISTYEDILTTYNFRVMDGSETVAGISSDRFKIYIGEEEIEHSIFDSGTGNYNLSFEAPTSSGNYNLRILLDDYLDEHITLDVNDLSLSASFRDSDFSDIKNTNHIIHFTSGSGRVGLASNTPTNRIDVDSEGDMINITKIPLEKELFIFNTKDSASISSRESLLNEDIFLEKINPSFGYQIDDKYIINFILKYDNFLIQSRIGETLKQGQYNILVRNTVSDTGQRVIRFSNSDTETGRIVLQD